MVADGAGFHPFPAALVFEVGGRDAPRYLNARLSNDLDLASRGCEAAMLSDRGRIEGYFWVLQTRPESYLLWCDGGDGAAVQSALSRYIVADRVSVANRSAELRLIHCCRGVAPDLNGTRVLCAPRARVAAAGCDLLVPAEEFDAVLEMLASSSGPQLCADDWFERRFAARHLSFPSELNDRLLLPECELPQALSAGKGCYVGQEVGEKAYARGKAPRRIVRLELSGGEELAAPAEVYEAAGGERPRGELLSCRVERARREANAFAVLRRESAAPGTAIRVGEWRGMVRD